MSDETQAQQPPENADTPEQGTGTTEQAQAEQATDWERRYKDLQAEYTRTSQEHTQAKALLDALQSDDADTRLRAARQLGYEFADEADDDTQQHDDDDEPYLTREEWQSYQAAQREQANEAAEQARQAEWLARAEQHVEASLDAIDGLDKSDRDWIVGRAMALAPTPEGMPDIQAAHKEFAAWEQQRMKKWAASKKAHYFSPVGGEGTQQPDLDTHEGRVQYALGRLAAEQQ